MSYALFLKEGIFTRRSNLYVRILEDGRIKYLHANYTFRLDKSESPKGDFVPITELTQQQKATFKRYLKRKREEIKHLEAINAIIES